MLAPLYRGTLRSVSRGDGPTSRLASRARPGVVLCVVLAAVSPAPGQVPLDDDLSVVAWPTSPEVLRSSPWEIASTGDGLMWIATEEGIVRFDGATFRRLERDDLSGISAEYVRALHVRDDSVLWLGLVDGGLARYEGGVVRRVYTVDEGLPSNSIYALASDVQGTLWIGTAEGVAALVADDIVPYPTSDEHPGRFVEALEPHADGGMWVGTRDGGVFHLRQDGSVGSSEAGGATPFDVRALGAAADGGLWIGTAQGLFHRDRAGRLGRIDAVGTRVVNDLHLAADGTLWLAVGGGGVAHHDHDSWRWFTEDHGLPDNDPLALHEDPEGGVWVATRERGWARIHHGPIRAADADRGLASAIALAILETRDGTVWVSSFGAGVTRFGPAGIDTLTAPDALPGNVVLSMAEDSVGGVWVGTRNGAQYRRGMEQVRFGSAEGLPHEAVLSILPMPDGSTYLGTNSGIVRLEGGSIRSPEALGADARLSIFALAQGPDGAVWAGTNGAGVYRIDEDSVRLFTREDGLASEVVYDVFPDADGTVWLATQSAGIVRYRDDAFRAVGRTQGLYDDQVYRILDDGAGNFWMCSNRGLFTVARSELHAVADGLADEVASPAFGRSFGMPDVECNGGVSPAGWKTQAGELWFPTMGGAAIVDPARALADYRRPLEPVVVRMRATAPDGAIAEVRRSLPPGARRLTIDYTAAAYAGGEDLQFQFSLAPYDRNWIDGGTDRQVEYTNLSPGEYRFDLRVRRPGGPWSDATVAAVLSMPPLLHQTWWFRSFAAVLLTLGVFIAHRLRVANLRKRQAELLRLVQERKRAEARYRDLFENATDVALTLDRTGRIGDVNAEGVRALGQPEAELLGCRLADLMTDDGRSALSGVLDELSRNPSATRSVTLTAVRPDRAEVVLDFRFRAITDGSGYAGAQGLARDVTEKLELERQLLQSQKMETVGRLTGGIAHDFNNLLTAIRGFASLAISQLPGHTPVARDLQEIEAAADRATALARRLLTFGRTGPAKAERVELNHVVRGTLQLLGRLLGDAVVIETDLCEESLPIEIDRVQLEQVILNLAVNARDAMKGAGTLTVATRSTPDGQATLSFSDTGTGIDPDDVARIFEPFFTTKGPEEGTGLGLSTVQAIVRQAGGTIDVESVPGAGATFLLRFPLTGPLEPAAVRVESEPIPSPAQATLLVVEDDASVRRIMRRLLTREGYRVLDAGDLAEALVLWQEHGPTVDVLMTDLNLPDASGEEVIRTVRGDRPTLPVLVTTGMAEGSLGAWDGPGKDPEYVTKPFTAEQLASAVRRALA